MSNEFAENARDSVVGAAVSVPPRIKLDIFRSGFEILATPPHKNVTLEEAARHREAETRAAGVHKPFGAPPTVDALGLAVDTPQSPSVDPVRGPFPNSPLREGESHIQIFSTVEDLMEWD